MFVQLSVSLFAEQSDFPESGIKLLCHPPLEPYQYLKKKPTTRKGDGPIPSPPNLIKSGGRSGKWHILLELVQQFAGLADGQVFRYIAVKPLVHQLLRIKSLAAA
jgi:hypothetical protein